MSTSSQNPTTPSSPGLPPEREQEIRERVEAAYPGPWRWRGNTEARHMRLQSPSEGGMTVMDFDRWGMQGAQPRFGIDRMMRKAEELVTYEVHRLDWVDKSEPPYRADIDGIDHPDAEFIAHAREDVPALLAELDRLRAELDATAAALHMNRERRIKAETELDDARAAVLPAWWQHLGDEMPDFLSEMASAAITYYAYEPSEDPQRAVEKAMASGHRIAIERLADEAAHGTKAGA